MRATMSAPSIGEKLREITVRNPAFLPVFESLGIDYCCGGEQTLGEACKRAGVSEDEVLRALAAAQSSQASSPVTAVLDSAKESVEKLIAYILDTHHAYIRREAPRLETLFEKVVHRHGERHPELHEIRKTFTNLHDELEAHMFKEENVLFPLLIKLDERVRGSAKQGPFISAAPPIARMRMEHEDAGEQLDRMRTLAGGYLPPQDACASYRALYDGLKEFERDLHQHVHLENNILFPRAEKLEAEKASHAQTR